MHVQSYCFTNEAGKRFYYPTFAQVAHIARERPTTTIHAITTDGRWILLP